MTHAEVDLAVLAAPALAAAPPTVRASWLATLAEHLEKHVDELVAIADEETRLGAQRLTGEVARAAAQLRFYGEVAAEGSYLGVTVDHATGTAPRLVRVNRPLGPVAVFGASNFPFAFGVLGNDTASAIAAGCPVVAKAHPAHPVLCTRLAELAQDALLGADAPEGTFTMVHGFEAGVSLVRDAGIRAVAFTGSQAGGTALWRIANEREQVIPVYAEMGTVNPVVVTPAGARRIEEVARGFVGSFTLGSGQFCTKPGLLLVPSGHDASGAVGRALEEADPRPVMLTTAIADAVERGVRDLVAGGAEVVTALPGPGGDRSASAAVLRAPASALRAGSRLVEECFGAVALVVEYDDQPELLGLLTELPGCLAAGVMPGGADDPDVGPLLEVLAGSAGRLCVGDWPTGVAVTWAQHHGGPWPATSDPATTSVGGAALDRFVRPVTYQSAVDAWLPPAARTGNPWRVPRRVDGRLEVPA